MSSKPTAAQHTLAALQAQFQQAAQLHQQGQLAAAQARYQEILKLQPRHADALHLLGVLKVQLGAAQEGIALIQNALAVNPHVAGMHANLGNAYSAAGQLTQALAAYDKALALQPGMVAALCNKANLLQQLGRPEQAMALCDQVLKADPRQVMLLNVKAGALLDLKRPTDALNTLDAALRLHAQYPEAWSNRGNALAELGRFDEALQSYAQALKLAPNHPQIHHKHGTALRMAGQHQQAIESFDRSLALQPGQAVVLCDKGTSLKELGRTTEAIGCLQQALAIDPGNDIAWCNLLFAMSFAPGITPPDYLAQARRFGQLLSSRARPFTTWPQRSEPVGTRKLRIGWLSGDMRQHAVGYFLEGLLQGLDPSRCEIVAFPTRAERDALTDRLQARCAGWHPLHDLNDEVAAQRVHAQGIDVLVDLSGVTDGHRLGVLAWRPAPVQVSWLGYLASTGLPGMDWLLADGHSAPAAHDSHFTEKVWRLPESAMCFSPSPVARELPVAPPPCLARGHITFGCSQNPAKVSEASLTAWGRLLTALPTARLRLQNRQFDHARGRLDWTGRLQAAGIPLERVDMVGSIADHHQHLLGFNDIDILLDTFPYPGITTTCETLWMGVPTLTLEGNTMLSRQGSSIMTLIGLGDWVAQNTEHYVELACQMAARPEHLASLRAGMRERLLNTALFDPHRFASQWLEALLALHASSLSENPA